MKGISDLEKIGLVKPKPQETTGPEADGDLFKKTFEKALNDTGGTPTTETTASVSSLGEIQSPAFRVDESGPLSLETGTESLLNKLDTYIQALTDPHRSLKEIEPLLMDVKQEADQLNKSLLASSGDQGELKSIAEQSTLLAQVEYQKFVRGDYT